MTAKSKQKSKDEQERELSKELEMTFPASDPLSVTQPGGGITGPEATKAPGEPGPNRK